MNTTSRQSRLPRRLAIGAVLGALIAVVVAAPGHAAPANDGADPATQLTTITVTRSGPIAVAPARVAAGAPTGAVRAAVAAATHCWYYDDTRQGKNIFGGTLFTFHTRTNWCGDGTWVRNYAYTNTDASTIPGWVYEGLEQNYDQYGVNWNEFHSYRQGQFCLLNCIAGNVSLTNDVLVGPAGQVYHG